MPSPPLRRRISDDPLILPFYLPSLIVAVANGMLVPIIPLYAASFGVSYGLIGFLLAGDALGALVSDIPAGFFIRRAGTRRAMLFGLLCVAITTAALFWAGSVTEALVYRLLAGIGMALLSVSRHTYVASLTAVANRGRAISVFGGTMRIGRFAGPAIGGVFAAALGLRAAFLLIGVVYALALVAVALFVRPVQATEEREPPLQAPRRTVISDLRQRFRVLAAAGAAQILAMAIRAGRRSIIPLYAADVIGLDVQAIGFIVSISSAADVSLFYPAGLIMDRFGRKYAIVPSFLIQGLGMALVPFTSTYAGLLAASMLTSLGNGLSSGTMMTLGADLAPEHARGEFLGIWRLIGDVGITAGPLAVGGVADLLALPASAMVIAGIGFAAGVVFLLVVPETLRRRHPAPSA
jgi:MFS family permease